jgi:hypothetical protein
MLDLFDLFTASGTLCVHKKLRHAASPVAALHHQRRLAGIAALRDKGTLSAVRACDVKIPPAGRATHVFALDFRGAGRAGIVKRAVSSAHGTKPAVVTNQRTASYARLIISGHFQPP